MEPQEPQSHRRAPKTLFVFQFQAQDPPWDPAVAAQPQQHFHGARDEFGKTENAKKQKSRIAPEPLRKGSSDIHLGEELLLFTGIPKDWGALYGTSFSSTPGTGPAAPQNILGGDRAPLGGDRALCCPTDTNPSSSSAPWTFPVCPRGSHLAPRSSTDVVSSSQRCETRQEFIITWENKFHHSQRMLHTCPDTALQDSFPFACFP